MYVCLSLCTQGIRPRNVNIVPSLLPHTYVRIYLHVCACGPGQATTYARIFARLFIHVGVCVGSRSVRDALEGDPSNGVLLLLFDPHPLFPSGRLSARLGIYDIAAAAAAAVIVLAAV